MTSEKQLDPFGFCFNIWHEILYELRKATSDDPMKCPMESTPLLQTGDMSARVRVQLFEDVK